MPKENEWIFFGGKGHQSPKKDVEICDGLKLKEQSLKKWRVKKKHVQETSANKMNVWQYKIEMMYLFYTAKKRILTKLFEIIAIKLYCKDFKADAIET